MNPYKYFALLLLPLLVVLGYAAGGWWNLCTPITCFILHPLFSLVNKRFGNAGQIVEPEKGKEHHFRFVAICFLPVLLGIFAWAITRIAGMQVTNLLLFAVSLGTLNGVMGFPLAHEFIHRNAFPEKQGGLLMLFMLNYPHYFIEHIGGHHVYACTPRDPHTARIGETLYHFLPRAIWGTYKNAWEIERVHLKKRGHGFISLYNRMLFAGIMQIFCWGILFFFFGPAALLFFFIQSGVAIVLLHIVNYLQHYGLLRKQSGEEKFERISAQHSWNSGHSTESFNLFQLEKHADHHMHPDHAFDSLQYHEESPRLPGGYTAMICLALVPPFWFRAVHKQLSPTP